MESYHGYVRTKDDAILLFEACETGILHYLQRTPSDTELNCIKSGSVFIWDQDVVYRTRWYDGGSWKSHGRSRGFLIYRGDKSNGAQSFSADRQADGNTPDSSPNRSEGHDVGKSEGEQRKTGGLVKQSLCVTTPKGQTLHLVSYHSRSRDDTPKLQRPTNDPQLQRITIDNSLRFKFGLLEAGATPTPTGRKPKPLLVAPHAANHRYGYSRRYAAVDFPYKNHAFHCAPVAPQNDQPGASQQGPPRPNYNDVPVHAQPLLFRHMLDKLHAKGSFPKADESPHTRHRVPVTQRTTSGHARSNYSQVGQVALPRIGSISNAPIDFPVQADIAPPGVSFACPGSPESYVSRHDSNFAGSYQSANGLAGEDKRMWDLLNPKIR